MTLWRDIFKEAWNEALKDAKMGSPQQIAATVIPPILAAWGVWHSTGELALTGVVAVAVLALLALAFFVVAVASTVDRRLKVATSDATLAQEKIAELNGQIAELLKPKAPAADYDGLYQNGLKVGTGVGGKKNLQDGVVFFDLLNGNDRFNPEREFVWQSLRLQIANSGVMMTGFGRKDFQRVVCLVQGEAT